MSYIDWKSPESPAQSCWRYFPLAVIAGMGVVVAVNAGMVYAALHSFPGAAQGDEGFALSNHYDAVLDRAGHEAALGWTVNAQTDDAGHPVVTLADRNGAALAAASITAMAERPLGAPHTQSLTFRNLGSGHYIADAALPASGQWELTVSASNQSHDLAVTRRVIVR